MQIDFYNSFYKRRNSTLRPAEGGIVSKYTCTGHLKEPCSILKPVISVQRQDVGLQDAAKIFWYSYAYIPSFHRYYFVEDWTWTDGTWTVSLSEDVLATHRNTIGNSELYVLRTDSNTSDFNGAITDTIYPATTNFSIEQVEVTNPFELYLADGTYVVGIISGADSNAVGAITYYAMTSSQFGDFKDVLFGNEGLNNMGLLDTSQTPPAWNVTEMTEEIFKTMYNPYQYIASCMWFPIAYSSFVGTAVSSIELGWWNFGSLSGKVLTQLTGSFYDPAIAVPIHPQAATRGKYLNYAPYTQMELYGKFGCFPIDTSHIEIGYYLINNYEVDYVTGQCLFETFVSPNQYGTQRKYFHKTEFLLGVPIQIAQIGRDYLGTANELVGAVGSAIGGAVQGFATGGLAGSIGGMMMGAGAGILSTIETSMPQLITSGVNGSLISNILSTVLVAKFMVVVPEDIEHKGRPLCDFRVIKNLSGYVLCGDGELDMDAFDDERREVEKYLTTGFFWE